MASAWNMFVKKIFNEGRSKNKAYSFKQALKDASRRKSEMGSSSSSKTKKRGKMSMSGGDFEPNQSSSFSDAAPFKGGKRRKSRKNRSSKRRR